MSNDIAYIQWGLMAQLNRIVPVGQNVRVTPADKPGMYLVDIDNGLLPPVIVDGPGLYHWLKAQTYESHVTYNVLLGMLQTKAIKQGRMLRQAELPL